MSTPDCKTPETDGVWNAVEGKTWQVSFEAMHDHAESLELRLIATKARLEEAEKLLAERLPDTLDWHTVMSDVHQYFADEKADRSRGRGTLLLTLLGQLRCERDELRAHVTRHQTSGGSET